MNLIPIGKVHSLLKTPGTRERVKARIEIFPEYAEGLKGIEAYEELLVLYWMDRLEEKDRKLTRQQLLAILLEIRIKIQLVRRLIL
jgi:tRNA (Thr-GGU) A37 N-methylase